MSSGRWLQGRELGREEERSAQLKLDQTVPAGGPFRPGKESPQNTRGFALGLGDVSFHPEWENSKAIQQCPQEGFVSN